eukprot:1186345-Prorocentrum_minimum.AAC.1
MQAELACVHKLFLWSSIEGVYGDEDGQSDAFAALMEILRRRVDNQVGLHTAVKPLLSHSTTGEFNSPTDSLRTPNVRAEPYPQVGLATDTVKWTMKTLASHLITGEFNSPTDSSLRTPNVRVEPYGGGGGMGVPWSKCPNVGILTPLHPVKTHQSLLNRPKSSGKSGPGGAVGYRLREGLRTAIPPAPPTPPSHS